MTIKRGWRATQEAAYVRHQHSQIDEDIRAQRARAVAEAKAAQQLNSEAYLNEHPEFDEADNPNSPEGAEGENQEGEQKAAHHKGGRGKRKTVDPVQDVEGAIIEEE